MSPGQRKRNQRRTGRAGGTGRRGWVGRGGDGPDERPERGGGDGADPGTPRDPRTGLGGRRCSPGGPTGHRERSPGGVGVGRERRRVPGWGGVTCVCPPTPSSPPPFLRWVPPARCRRWGAPSSLGPAGGTAGLAPPTPRNGRGLPRVGGATRGRGLWARHCDVTLARTRKRRREPIWGGGFLGGFYFGEGVPAPPWRAQPCCRCSARAFGPR